jgi:RimJ/RimL family protein N-acetyltransferase
MNTKAYNPRESHATEFELQPLLHDNIVSIRPLLEQDFEVVFKLASDPLVWEQHPTRDRYKKEVFEKYFSGAIESKGAFLVLDVHSGLPIGCTRFYDLGKEPGSVAIGYTFLSRNYWGTTHNRALKSLMIDHAFKYVDKIIFHVGIHNIRSQKAVERLGAKNTGTEDVLYTGDAKSNLNIVYHLSKEDWDRNLSISNT